MNSKRKIILTSIGILLLLSVVVAVSYAYFYANVYIDGHSNVSTNLEAPPNFTFESNNTSTIVLNVTYEDMKESHIGDAVSNTANMSLSLSSNDNIPMYCTYDLVWTWEITDVANDQYSKSTGADLEYTVSGSSEYDSFDEMQVNDYGYNTYLFSGYISNNSSTPVTYNWEFLIKFYNGDYDQEAIMNANLLSKIEVQNLVCYRGEVSTNVDIIASANSAFGNPDSFASKILADNGGKDAIEAKGAPDFSEQAPALTYAEGTLPASASTYTPVDGNYFTFANSYTVNPTTGKLTLKNIDETDVTISNNVKTFSELSTKLQELNQLEQPMYVGNIGGSTTQTLLSVNNTYMYQIIEITSTSFKYKLVYPEINTVDSTLDGVYATDDDYTAITGRKSYYFRGAVDNNWVSFAGYYWRIIRINGDGSIRIMYSGTIAPTEETKVVITNSSTQLSGRAFNTTRDSAEYVGWKYTMGENHGYANSSTIKGDDSSPAVGSLDEWYYSNIASNSTYSSKINPNQILCNDRTSYTSASGTTPASGTGTSLQYFGAYVRNIKRHQPSLICPDNRDKFTTNGVAIGNEALTYPVGLITADEVSMAGLIYYSYNPKNYLYNGQNSWTASPYFFYSNRAYAFAVYSSGVLDYNSVTATLGARPVVSLKSDIAVTGDGTWNNPYRFV